MRLIFEQLEIINYLQLKKTNEIFKLQLFFNICPNMIYKAGQILGAEERLIKGNNEQNTQKLRKSCTFFIKGSLRNALITHMKGQHYAL